MTGTLLLATGLRAVTREVDPALDPLEHLGADGFTWMHDGLELATAGTVAHIAVADAAAVLAAVETDDPVRRPGTGPLAVGALPFDPAAPRHLTIPSLVAGRVADGPAWVTEIAPAGSGAADLHEYDGPQPTRYTVAPVESRETWRAAVEDALAAIARGELGKVVLSRAVTVDADRPYDRRAVLRRLRDQQPGCFVYADRGLVGATPELLVRRTGTRVESRPLAGTSTGDGTSLRSSGKDHAEHAFVIDELARVLRPLCESLDVPDAPCVLRFADVAHLATSVAGRLRAPLPTAADIAELLHPTPAVAGTPPAAALDAIARLEPTPRGRYAGPVGWVDAAGDGEWGVALRGAELDGAHAVLRTGAGIVAGSDPDREWVETEAKLDPMLRALVRV